MLQPMLGTWRGETGCAGQHRVHGGAQIRAGHGQAVAGTAVVELAAIDKLAVFVK